MLSLKLTSKSPQPSRAGPSRVLIKITQQKWLDFVRHSHNSISPRIKRHSHFQRGGVKPPES